MLKENFFKVILILIVILLAMNLFKNKISLPILNEKVKAQTSSVKKPQNIEISSIYTISCSDDGKFVYIIGEFYDTEEKAANRECIYRSDNFGKPGSWEMVAKQNIENL